MPDNTEISAPVTPRVKVQRADNFVSLYANNVIVSATAWDMTLTFGQFDETDDGSINRQTLAATIPFGLAKLMLYWIEASLIANEIETGQKIGLRTSVLPPPPPPLSPEEEKDPGMVMFSEAISKLRERLLAKLA